MANRGQGMPPNTLGVYKLPSGRVLTTVRGVNGAQFAPLTVVRMMNGARFA
ncbi:hypothetical protein [Bacteroides sp. 519]|uniref:hypothetical protein n=1 Tax=Bacteroides sp. 519 TaxID=2302937 RepID=UPI0013D08CAE|nr:hypothetical protein [Bacteroides sp. 519]